MKRYLTILPVILLFAGCAHHPMDADIDMTPPKYVEQIPSKDVEVSNNTGSLFSNGDNLFSDKKAMKVNDIVTVLINFKARASSTGKKQTSESVNDGMGGINLLTSGINHLANMIGGKTGFNSMNDVSVNRSYKGQGKNVRDDSFSATVTARIVKVLKNGNYFIAGSREVMIDGEKNIIRVCGVIRPSDIDSTNTIDSKYISDAKIEYKTEGDIAQATDKNWFAKFLDAVSPF